MTPVEQKGERKAGDTIDVLGLHGTEWKGWQGDRGG